MDWLLDHTTIVTLAACGGIASVMASALKDRGVLSHEAIRRCNIVAYALMGASMLLFIVAGFHPIAPHSAG